MAVARAGGGEVALLFSGRRVSFTRGDLLDSTERRTVRWNGKAGPPARCPQHSENSAERVLPGAERVSPQRDRALSEACLGSHAVPFLQDITLGPGLPASRASVSQESKGRMKQVG